MKELKINIINILAEHKDGVFEKELVKKLKSLRNPDVPKAKYEKKIMQTLGTMKKMGDVSSKKGGLWKLKNADNYFTASVYAVSQRSGFIRDNNEEFFVRGKDLRGAVTGDLVLAERLPEGKARVLKVLEESAKMFTGTVVAEKNKLMVLSDKLCEAPLFIARSDVEQLNIGDKVAFSIKKRGAHHYEHTVEIKQSFGSAENACSSAQAYLLVNGFHTEFPEAALAEAQKLSFSLEEQTRLDLRTEPIFTIDGADTKDIDDAVSIEKTEFGFRLGVHIADVSHYVKKGSALDKEAFCRGTSVYYADKVLPMLPKELSNGICSLNPNEDRLAFSCLMEVSDRGELISYRFEKTVIKSRVKGVYSEVNAILDGTADELTKNKYKDVLDEIPIMQELAEILYKNRVNRGSPEIDTPEPKIITDENGVCTGVYARTRGAAEKIIEEFMLLANKSAAALAMRAKIPFVYRVHEPPASDKLLALCETLVALGVEPKQVETAADLARIISENRTTERAVVINRAVLRAMMKARYSEEPLGHFGLVMPEYAHFTSPIRRYADLSVHRILTDYVNAVSAEKLTKKYAEFAKEAAFRASATELSAVRCERDCENFYMAEFMKNHIGEEFDGFISGVSPSGIFVELKNTVEGMVSVTRLPVGDYEVLHNVILSGAADGTRFVVGDKVRVKCVSASVSGGFVDFELADATLLDSLLK